MLSIEYDVNKWAFLSLNQGCKSSIGGAKKPRKCTKISLDFDYPIRNHRYRHILFWDSVSIDIISQSRILVVEQGSSRFYTGI